MIKPLKFVPIDLYSNNKNKEKPVIMVYKDGRTCRFPSVRDAGRMMGIPQSNIVACLKGRAKTAGGYGWKYADVHDRLDKDTSIFVVEGGKPWTK